MLQRVRIRPLPASRLLSSRSQFSEPIHNFRARPSQVQLPQPRAGRHFHYDPHAVVFQLPLKTRLKYMAYGALSLIALGGSYLTWQLYGLYGQRNELEEELKDAVGKLRAFNEEFARGFSQARATSDHHALRQLTFDLARRSLADTETEQLPPHIVEFGELPGLPFDDPRSGRELVPREDTLILLEKDELDRIATCHVAVNLELDDVYRGLADPKPEPDADKLLEILRRVGDQIELWRRQGRLFEDHTGEIDLVILLGFREKNWALEYAAGHWNSLAGPGSIVEQSESIVRAEEMLAVMSKDNKGFFRRR
ncbi:hypothetical protein BKA67DRAFT_536583 [Truncatella angustata]|uniref:Uncharacterized protein n=1 Tax=Truncatella angustata TaxID=152316 RepID=A0A9P8UIM2_9PEZI|nr:uncharacterized protein BKA67DRAFT_536583 [Truncatella angustata]KAH6652871.1 hypothetical protein BKA67DRAFT_536583 [Truncatella angustata]KAH8202281.1 hypothetical protein TruAng_003558 [Truncatella angustata]